MEVVVNCYSASGPKARHCAFLAQRYDAEYGYKPGDAECWICINEYTPDFKGQTTVTNGTLAWYTGLWTNLGGAIYMTRHDGWVIRNPDIFAERALSRWQNVRIEDRMLWGVFGVGDDVFVWGHDPKATAGVVYPPSDVFRREGDGWQAMPGPGFQIIQMHGSAADNLWVASPNGEVARFDGARWHAVKGGKGPIYSLWVASPDEVYVTAGKGVILKSSGKGLKQLTELPGAREPGDAACVAKWNGDLWVGSLVLGLFRGSLDGVLECAKPNIACSSFDARDELVITMPNRIGGTADGREYKSYGNDCVQTVRAPHPLCKDMG